MSNGWLDVQGGVSDAACVRVHMALVLISGNSCYHVERAIHRTTPQVPLVGSALLQYN